LDQLDKKMKHTIELLRPENMISGFVLLKSRILILDNKKYV
jgi:hypothetical protein